MTNEPILTVGIPVYNGEPFIAQALSSIRAQSMRDIQIRISDNSSTDNTFAICQSFAEQDERIVLSRHERNQGALANFLAVLAGARGEFFMWAAADDLWHPEFASRCVAALRGSPDRVFAATRFQCVSLQSRLLNRRPSDVLRLIELEDPRTRVLAYSSLPWGSHKDNLVYGVYRSAFIKDTTCRLSTIDGFKSVIGGAANEYRLSKAQGIFIPELLFVKRYRVIPPGHPLGPYLGVPIRIVNAVRGRRSRRSAADYTEGDHYRDLSLLAGSGMLDAELARHVVSAYRSGQRASR